VTQNMTRGGLVAATITNLNNTGEIVHCMFNPYEYTVTKKNDYKKKDVIGKDVPKVTFQQGGAQSLALKLTFDTLPTGVDVRDRTALLWKMSLIDPTTINPDSDKGTPPPVAFEWGRLYFKAIITDLSEQFTLFSDTGTPLRCVVSLTLQQYEEPTAYAPQGGETNVVNKKPEKTTTVVQGDRLDNIAAANTGSSSNYRDVAANNNIDNPLNVPSGTTLNT